MFLCKASIGDDHTRTSLDQDHEGATDGSVAAQIDSAGAFRLDTSRHDLSDPGQTGHTVRPAPPPAR